MEDLKLGLNRNHRRILEQLSERDNTSFQKVIRDLIEKEDSKEPEEK